MNCEDDVLTKLMEIPKNTFIVQKFQNEYGYGSSEGCLCGA